LGNYQKTISVIIPVFNSDETLNEVIKQLCLVLPAIASQYEIVLVNDGSRDHSWELIYRLSEELSWVRGINLMRNYGQHNALLCGIRAARHEIIVTMDDDLQHPPEEIPKLLSKLSEGYDVVYGTPQREQHGLWRDMASQVTKIALQGAMGSQTARMVSAFRAFRTSLREAFQSYNGPFVSIDVLLTWGTTRFSAIPVQHNPRKAGLSNYTFRKLVVHALNMMTGFSVLPLQLASLVGFVFTFFGLLVLVYVIVRYLIQGGSVPGFPFLASTLAIFSGAQLFALGIIGEYIARMHFRLMDKPPYTIRKISDHSERKDNDFEHKS
jgi:undecaprenyl-phosphate 4-deoxy-4-formamido-L-arabinose transferase